MNSPRSENSYWMTGIMLIVALIGFVVIWLGWDSVQPRTALSDEFVPTGAIVTKSKTVASYNYTAYGRRGYSHRHRTWVTKINFQYTTPGTVARVGSTEVDPSWYHGEWGDPATMDQGYWKPGREFTLFVNPYKPDDYSLIDRPTPNTLVTLGSIVLALIGGLGFYPMLFKMLGGEPVNDYRTPDDPRSLASDNHLRF